MPLIILVGPPSSGKSTQCQKIAKYFREERSKCVHVVSDNDVIKLRGYDKNLLYFDSQKEKELRGILKSEALRLLTRDELVILDASNYIKGYRYELYCASKSVKTTQVTVECVTPHEDAWAWNEARDDPSEKYSRESFDALIMRYEAPDSRNRWDSPMVSLVHETELPAQQLYEYLWERKPPPPNMSTQSAPLASADFVYELDKVTQEIVQEILNAQKLGVDTAISVPGGKLDNVPSNITPAQLARHRRQFLNYTKLHPPSNAAAESTDRLAALFVHFLNSTFNT